MTRNGKEGQGEVYRSYYDAFLFRPRRPDLSERRLEEQDMGLIDGATMYPDVSYTVSMYSLQRHINAAMV